MRDNELLELLKGEIRVTDVADTMLISLDEAVFH